MAWAIEQQEIHNPTARLVLICLANYASADGTSAFPSVARLAADTGLSERAVQQKLRELEQAMMIRKGNQALPAAHIKRSDRRPVCYELLMKPRGAPYSPRTETGCNTTTDGVNVTTKRGEPRAPDPSSYPSVNRQAKTIKKELSESEKERRRKQMAELIATLKH